jgi:hypothetical protein
MDQNTTLLVKKKAGRPLEDKGRNPKYLLRNIQMLHSFQCFRDGGLKYEAAISCAIEDLNTKYRIYTNETEFKRVLAEMSPLDSQFEFAVRSQINSEGHQLVGLHLREKPAYAHPSLRRNSERTT